MIRLAAFVLGAAVFTAAGVIHGITATAATSMIFLGLLWLFAPAPLVFLWRTLTRPSSKLLRMLTASYLGVSAVLAVVVLLGVSWIGSERGIHPSPCENLPRLEDYRQLQAKAQRVSFNSREGTKRAGWFIPGESKATVLLLHGYRCEKREMLRHADFLHETGYSVFLFDFRNRGESEGDAVTLGYYEQLDVLGAIDYVKTRPDVDASRLGVLGISMGGATAIMAAAQAPELKAVVSESAFRSAQSSVEQAFTHFIDLPSFPYAPITLKIIERRLGISVNAIVPQDAVGRISPRPVFIIHGAEDDTIGPADGEALYAAAGEPKQWWLIPNSGHAEGVKVLRDEYARRVAGFFDRYLRG